METRGIDRGHITQPHNHNGRKCVEISGRLPQLLRGSKQKRPVNPKNGNIPGNLLVLQDMRAAIPNIFFRYRRNRSRCEIRWMYSSAARIVPTSTATVRSAKTVSANVTAQTAMSAFESRTIVPISRHSPML